MTEPAYYMRDNHTFKRLSVDPLTAMQEIAEEFKAGYRCGSLFSHHPDMHGKSVNAPYDLAKQPQFFSDAMDWLIDYQKLVQAEVDPRWIEGARLWNQQVENIMFVAPSSRVPHWDKLAAVSRNSFCDLMGIEGTTSMPLKEEMTDDPKVDHVDQHAQAMYEVFCVKQASLGLSSSHWDDISWEQKVEWRRRAYQQLEKNTNGGQ